MRDLYVPQQFEAFSLTDTKGTFSIGPLMPSYAHALGNALRRVLLSSLEGYAITSVSIPGVLHEFDSIPGVREDMVELILNLKQVRLKALSQEDEATLQLSLKGDQAFTAAQLGEASSNFEVLNGDHVICHLDEKANLDITLTIGRGRGYVAAEEQQPKEAAVGQLAVDALFSPVKNVHYSVSNTLFQGSNDYEKLELSVLTDGSLTPQQALQTAASYLAEHFQLLSTQKEVPLAVAPTTDLPGDLPVLGEEEQRIQHALNEPITNLGFSSRIYNSLLANGIQTLWDLVEQDVEELKRMRNFGLGSFQAVEKLLQAKGLTFGMNLDKYYRLTR